jgi:hypothetical protein
MCKKKWMKYISFPRSKSSSFGFFNADVKELALPGGLPQDPHYENHPPDPPEAKKQMGPYPW